MPEAALLERDLARSVAQAFADAGVVVVPDGLVVLAARYILQKFRCERILEEHCLRAAAILRGKTALVSAVFTAPATPRTVSAALST